MFRILRPLEDALVILQLVATEFSAGLSMMRTSRPRQTLAAARRELEELFRRYEPAIVPGGRDAEQLNSLLNYQDTTGRGHFLVAHKPPVTKKCGKFAAWNCCRAPRPRGMPIE